MEGMGTTVCIDCVNSINLLDGPSHRVAGTSPIELRRMVSAKIYSAEYIHNLMRAEIILILQLNIFSRWEMTRSETKGGMGRSSIHTTGNPEGSLTDSLHIRVLG